MKNSVTYEIDDDLGPLARKPREPVALDAAFEDPDAIRALVRRHAPYWPVMRYVARGSEMKAVGGADGPVFVPPWFRGDWAYREPLVDGAAAVLNNVAFRDAAARMFDAETVVPQVVYLNLMGPMPSSGPPHVDVPAFRGLDRREYPVWLLHVMHRSGLFAAWKIDIATAVAWFYEGEGGVFEYWADGPQAPPRRVDAPLSNRAVVGDNDVMFHRVGRIGEVGREMPQGASLDAELLPDADAATRWRIVDAGREIASYEASELRISISWKAECFADANAVRIWREHEDDLDFETVVDRLLAALADAGERLGRPADPLHDDRFIRALSELYPISAPNV